MKYLLLLAFTIAGIAAYAAPPPAVGAGINPRLFAGEDAVFGEGQSRLVAGKDEATMAP